MGVNDLWPILEPVKQHAHLQSLQGKTLAVDLSLWVCEALTVKKMIGTVVKPHLRNLFFRISSLTLMGVKLIFVMEGDAPKLKADVMSKRNEMRYGPPQNQARRPKRSCFKAVLKECLDMLECLGVPWVQAAGEAEAMCAYLNAQGYVDGCLTNDGDAFLYGAQTVYRNFTMNTKDPHVDCYTMSSIKKKLGLDRDSLIGLAVLLGCDYLPKGVPGVGKEQALKLIRALKGQSLLQRFDQWKEESNSLDPPPVAVKKPAHCSVCAHPGSPKDHERNGCRLCESERYCEPHDYEYRCHCEWHHMEHRRQQGSVEDGVKKRACSCEGFPFHEVIQEFQLNKDRLMKKIHCQRPDLQSFQMFALEKMEWPRHYACEKLMVLLTHHDMMERKSGRVGPGQLRPVRITHTRIRNGIPCFEVQWQKPEHYVIAAEAVPGTDVQPGPLAVLTVEEASLFEAAYPNVVAQYQEQVLESRVKKPKSKKNKPKRGDLPELEEVAGLLSQVKLSHEMVPGQNLKSNLKIPPDEKWQQKTTPAVDSWLFVGAPLNSKARQPPAPSPLRLRTAQHDAAGDCSSSVSEHQDNSSVIEALQLSSIDWEGTSFSASPGTQAPTTSAHLSDPGGDPGQLLLATISGAGSIHDIRGQDPWNSGPARGHSALDLNLLPLKERVCARAWEQSQYSSPLDGCPTHWIGLEASSLPRTEGNLAAKSRSSCEPQQIDHHPPGRLPVFGLQNGQEKSDMAPRKAPFLEEKPRVNTCVPHIPRKTAERHVGQEHTQVHPESQTALKRVPKKSVCLPCSSSNEENEPAGRNEKCPCPKGKLWPQQRHPTCLLTNVPKPAPREACQGAGAPRPAKITESSPRPALSPFPLPHGEEKDASLVLESPLPLAQRLKLKFQSS
ncbi:flap endonuclease GEN homolog 1 [Trichosurus vulpecula]|uniref:flap endonuclease GEN homolog 1 n=1 Tax=Trichosurus vulpecula TaxID=9337 RepID=UPI00186ADB90|nr:flap endonuclease GEN homolog 1 [Trichosurus vulpecula]